MTDRRIEYLPLGTLQGDPANPKAHDTHTINDSVGRFGYIEPIVLDGRTGYIVSGHGRTKTLLHMRDNGDTPPDGIRDDGSDWLVPVTVGWASRTDADAHAALIALNRTTELGGWVDDELLHLLDELAEVDGGLVGVGYTEDDIDELRDRLNDLDVPGGDYVGDPDAEPPVPRDRTSKLGDVWEFGPHRLVCGDATDREVVERLMQGGRAQCMWTDPPYGVSYVGKTKDALTIQNDGAQGLDDLLTRAFPVAFDVLEAGAPVYVAHADTERITFEVAFRGCGFSLRQNLIWVKNTMVLGHSDYHYRHEPILYGFKPGEGRLGRGSENWHGDDAQVTTFFFDKPSASERHPTMKPVGLIGAMLSNSAKRGDVVLDPFAGSGSTLFAADQMGCVARLVELDPGYCDQIVLRWQELTGKVALLNGRPTELAQA